MKIGNLDISAFKVGDSDCSIYLGDVKLYPSESYAKSVKMTDERSWSYEVDADDNVIYILKTASSTSELTTCTLTISGITEITFTQENAVSGSGLNYSSSIDNFETSVTTNSKDATWGLTNLDPSQTYQIKVKLIRKTSGQYVSGTNASANITWS